MVCFYHRTVVWFDGCIFCCSFWVISSCRHWLAHDFPSVVVYEDQGTVQLCLYEVERAIAHRNGLEPVLQIFVALGLLVCHAIIAVPTLGVCPGFVRMPTVRGILKLRPICTVCYYCRVCFFVRISIAQHLLFSRIVCFPVLFKRSHRAAFVGASVIDGINSSEFECSLSTQYHVFCWHLTGNAGSVLYVTLAVLLLAHIVGSTGVRLGNHTRYHFTVILWLICTEVVVVTVLPLTRLYLHMIGIFVFTDHVPLPASACRSSITRLCGPHLFTVDVEIGITVTVGIDGGKGHV